MIDFKKHFVRDTDTGKKCRINYSVNNHISGKNCVQIRGKEYNDNLLAVFPTEAKNDSDSMQDVFMKDRAIFFEDHPLYSAALAVAKEMDHFYKGA